MKKPALSLSHSAFTLVELSIVLVILGLLVGGVLSGRSLIRASEIRSIISEQNTYVTAVHHFKDKYVSLPGDMPTATQFWGLQAATCFNSVPAINSISTCNGDGDGKIIFSPVPNFYENWYFWHHLENADLITRRRTDVYTRNPKSKVSDFFWGFYDFGTRDGAKGIMAGNYNNSFELNSTTPDGYAFTPPELWGMDTKMDDGKPATGNVVARGDQISFDIDKCIDTNDTTNLAANYLLSSSDKGCAIIFRQQF